MKKNDFRGVLILILEVLLIFSTACGGPETNNQSNVQSSEEGQQPPDQDKPPEDVVREMPGTPVFLQYVLDCNTGNLVTPGTLVQPFIWCDSWEANRYERPFNAVDQNEYYPDLDLRFAEFGLDDGWVYVRIAVVDLRQGSGQLEGTYGIEIDLDEDGRGDLLVMAKQPGQAGEGNWGSEGVQILIDSNNDVGNVQPELPDGPYEGDGYDEIIYDHGVGDDPSAAWARVFFGRSAFVEIAFKQSLLENADTFRWWVWSDEGVQNYAGFEYHDFYSHEDAGDANETLEFFPVNQIYAVDNTCAVQWGKLPSEDYLCLTESFLDFSPPEGDCMDFETYKIWLFTLDPALESLPEKLLESYYLVYQVNWGCVDIPSDCPGMDKDIFELWLYALAPPLYPMTAVQLEFYYQMYQENLDCDEPPPPPPDDCPPMEYWDWKWWFYDENPYNLQLPLLPNELDGYYEDYKADLDCDDPPPPPPDIPDDCPPMEYWDWKWWFYDENPYNLQLPLLPNVLDGYYEAYKADLNCDDPPPPPPPPDDEPVCKTNLPNKAKCEKAGGTWTDGGLGAAGGPLPDYCKCP